jgi:hypothetical protein
MSITITWDNPDQTIIRETFTGRWTWEEFIDVCGRQAPAMMKTVPHTVHIISDFRESTPLPLGGAISQARNVTKNMPPNWGLLVVVSNNSLVSALVNVFSHAYSRGIGAHAHAVKTMDEAYALIGKETPKDAEAPSS